MTASVDALITAAGGPAWDEASYAKLRAVTRAKLESTTARVLDSVRTVLTAWHRVQARIGELTAPVLADARRDATRQVNALISPGFVTAAGTARLGDLARYLQAVELRIDKLRADPARDAQWTAEVKVVADEYAADVAALPAGVEQSPELQEIRWMIEQLAGGAVRPPDADAVPGIGEADPEGVGRATAVAGRSADTVHRGFAVVSLVPGRRSREVVGHRLAAVPVPERHVSAPGRQRLRSKSLQERRHDLHRVVGADDRSGRDPTWRK